MIRPKPTKEVLSVKKALCKEASALIAPMGTKEFYLKKFSHSKKLPLAQAGPHQTIASERLCFSTSCSISLISDHPLEQQDVSHE